MKSFFLFRFFPVRFFCCGRFVTLSFSYSVYQQKIYPNWRSLVSGAIAHFCLVPRQEKKQSKGQNHEGFEERVKNAPDIEEGSNAIQRV
jgi:hypothetical protein